MGKQSREKRERRDGIIGGDITQIKDAPPSNKIGLEKTCIFIIRWGAYLAMFAPLIIDIRFFFPFVAPKTTLFRIIIEIISAAYIMILFSNFHRYRPRITPLFIAITCFLGIFILASFTGVNFSRSFWSTYERMTGIWTMLHLYAFFIILTSCFRKKEDWEKFLGVSVVVGVFLSLYVLFGSQASSRGGGTIGNTSFMAAYLLFDVFFAIILFLSHFLEKEGPLNSVERGSPRWGGWSLFWQIFSGASLAIMLPVFFKSTAFGAIIAFTAGMFLLFLGYLFCSRKKILRKLAVEVILIFIIVGILAVILQFQFIKSILNDILVQMSARFVIWETALKGFQERPILGWGPENFNVVFLKHYNPCMSLPECGAEVWFDRVHNIVLDNLVAMGLAGSVSYLLIFGAAIYGLLKFASRQLGRNTFIPLGLAALLGVYFLQNLLVFDMINTYLVFFLVLGFTGFLVSRQELVSENEMPKPFNPILAIGVAAVLAVFIWVGNIQPMIANHYIIKMSISSDVEKTVAFFRKSLDSFMNKYEARESFALKVNRIGYQDVNESDRPVFQKVMGIAESEMEKSIEENRLDMRHYLFLGDVYTSSYRLSKDPQKIKRAENVLAGGIILSAANQQPYWKLAEAKMAQGKVEEAISILMKAEALEPRVGITHWYLAAAYKIAGQNQLAKQEIIESVRNGFDFAASLDRINQVVAIYSSVGDESGLISLFERYITFKIYDKNAKLWAALAAVYANAGEHKKAEEAAKKAAELDSSMVPQMEEFLRQLAPD